MNYERDAGVFISGGVRGILGRFDFSLDLRVEEVGGERRELLRDGCFEGISV